MDSKSIMTPNLQISKKRKQIARMARERIGILVGWRKTPSGAVAEPFCKNFGVPFPCRSVTHVQLRWPEERLCGCCARKHQAER